MTSTAPHGTPGRYKDGCRCPVCRDAEVSRVRAAEARRLANAPADRCTGYRSGHRCDKCRAEVAAAARARRNRAKANRL